MAPLWCGARGRNRTGTGFNSRGILSPLHLICGDRARQITAIKSIGYIGFSAVMICYESP